MKKQSLRGDSLQEESDGKKKLTGRNRRGTGKGSGQNQNSYNGLKQGVSNIG